MVASHTHPGLRNLATDALVSLVNAAVECPEVELSDKPGAAASVWESERLARLVLEPLYQLSQFHADTRSKQLACLQHLLNVCGDRLGPHWQRFIQVVGEINGHESHSEAHIRLAFRCLQQILTDFLSSLSLDCYETCIDVTASFAKQQQDLNIALTAVGCIWNITDYFFSKQPVDSGDWKPDQLWICVQALLLAEPTLVDIPVPEGTKFTICGDVHGQFFDLLNIFELNGLPSESNPYLFNGDFVDRGSFSVECIFTLFSLKLLYPKSFFLARGNHESEYMNKIYGFEGEVKAKYTDKMVQLFREVFNLLPLAHLIDGRILVMHGGLFSSDDVTLEDIRKIDRNMDIPESGPMSELLWSDPQDLPGRAPSKRGVAVQFGPDVTERFCKKNGLDYIVRSHEVKEKGYEVAHSGRCITVFSAPNYCDTMGNKGAFITLTGGKDLSPKFTSFDCVPHPTVRPMAYSSSLMQLFS